MRSQSNGNSLRAALLPSLGASKYAKYGGFVLASTTLDWHALKTFASNFLKHPLMIGSIFPSSRYLAEHLLEKIDFSRARVIVEYGPGTGAITNRVLERLSSQGRLIAIETNPELAEHLQANTSDPRLIVVNGSAADVKNILAQHGFRGADYIISGIPFSTMPHEVRMHVLAVTRAALNPGGRLLVYQFTRTVLPYLRTQFSTIDCEFEVRNVLPAQLFDCAA
jgi:phospholipid N-methyltransferase